MKEVAFRWIDKFLVNIKLQENFLILFFSSLLVMLIVSLTLISAEQDQKNKQLQQEIHLVSNLISKTELSQNELSGILANSNLKLGNQGAYATQVPNTNVSISAKPLPGIFSTLGLGHYAIILFCIGFIIISYYYIRSFMGGALFNIYDAVKRLADGDLASRIAYAPARNEFNIIAQTIDRVSEREHVLVKTTQEAIALIQQISSQLRQRSNENATLTSQQQERIDSLASATEQMASSIREVASHAHDSSTQTSDATQTATLGLSQVESTQRAIKKLTSEINAASGAVADLDSSASQIDDVVSTINAISQQTNLLALNAAIEAARAGEQGRGFAVVADEVRTLAGRTQTATVEIQKMIEALQSNSQGLITVMKQTVAEAETSESLMESVSKNISQITSQNQYIADRSVEIAAAAEEQGAVADNIASDVDLVRTGSESVALMVTQTASEIETLNSQADVLENLMKDLKV
ncbi:methyl-accepting chemotaxis protein [Shewanella sp. Choline-02u-19]|uniref:methyl-accepting chemotaxis protein n=1 Tax=unclassified Shewanella TaxID=196818 RepID=UPI000C334EBA|nr:MULTISPECIES: methyl-accepting chemotaxis protein [unclassified Shewanella]PKG75544.1 methyl-accepting chemotaxis protein [Shewanella sp. GutCb]PKH60023.1 methyl-accepting chemotaxis protein [Shewanella sp. Bg11-22]PKI30704.1 methyl-accepting chemotaxis protein [Shewanella sp. Choline-02u-19]